jgi:hypothetical protein
VTLGLPPPGCPEGDPVATNMNVTPWRIAAAKVEAEIYQLRAAVADRAELSGRIFLYPEERERLAQAMRNAQEENDICVELLYTKGERL